MSFLAVSLVEKVLITMLSLPLGVHSALWTPLPDKTHGVFFGPTLASTLDQWGRLVVPVALLLRDSHALLSALHLPQAWFAQSALTAPAAPMPPFPAVLATMAPPQDSLPPFALVLALLPQASTAQLVAPPPVECPAP
jgi:hypothetical protein